MAQWYPDDFEQVWRAYRAPANASKKMAYAAYQKAQKQDLPPLPILLQSIYAYNEWLVKNGTPKRPYPKAHPATWINQARWEGFVAAESVSTPETEKLTADAEAAAASWPKEILEKLQLSQPVIGVWFLPCTFLGGPPPEIRCPSKFHADWLLSHFPQQIIRAAGPYTKITHR